MKTCIPFTLSVVGLAFAAAGTILLMIYPSIIDSILASKLVIKPDSPFFDEFVSTQIPIYKQFYMFNVTNPQAILSGGRPAVQQIGPFTYLEKRLKHDLNWTENTVEYLENFKFFFVPEMSNGLTEDILITSLNPVIISVASFVDDLQTPLRPLIQAIFKYIIEQLKINVFITRKVGEWLYHGYDDTLLLLLSKLTGNPQFQTGKFGFFYGKNGSDAGKYSVSTGSSGLDSLQVIDEFEGSKTLGIWSDPYCDMINGTIGGQFPLPLSADISMFSSDLCRSVYLTFEKKVSHGDLELYRYSIPYELLSSDMENQCYCVSPGDITCRSTLLNLSPCRDGISVVASTPHFYLADDDLVAAIDGISPLKEEHETYLDVEPNTGMTLSAMIRVQVNMPLKPFTALPDLAHVDAVIFPLFWLNESLAVPEEKARELHHMLNAPSEISEWVSFSLCALGTVFTLVSLTLLIWDHHGTRHHDFEKYYKSIPQEQHFLESSKDEKFSENETRLLQNDYQNYYANIPEEQRFLESREDENFPMTSPDYRNKDISRNN